MAAEGNKVPTPTSTVGIKTEPLSDIKTEPGAHIPIQSRAGYIKLRVQGQDGTEMHVYVKSHTKMVKLMDVYTQRVGLQDREELRFLFDGRQLDVDDTAETLDLEEGDVIDVYQRMTGGGTAYK